MDDAPRYLRSSFCAGGSCVEVAILPEGRGVMVRDSKSPNIPARFFTPSEWKTFLIGVKAGEFDTLS